MKAVLVGSAIAALAAGIAIAQPAPPAPPGVAQGTTAPLPPRAPMPPRAPDGARQMHVRMRSDHVLTREEAVRHVRKMFERLDTNHDGYVTREEANAIFAGLDGLHERMEGMRHEMDGMREHMKTMRFDVAKRMDAGAMFDKLDSNHDGVISRQEFMSGHAKMHEDHVIVMRDGMGAMLPIPPIPPMPDMKDMHMHAMGGGFGGRLFDMADANHDGRVSLKEAEAAALAHFDRADANHDGKISPDERQHVRMIRIERRQS